jgi:hypothetical protein
MTNEFSLPSAERSPSANTSPVTDFKNKLSEDISSTREIIKDGSGAVIQQVDQVVSEQTHFVGHQVSGVAAALEKIGAELESSDQRQVGRYARQIGRSVAAVAEKIEGKDLGEIASLAENFGRKQPIAFLAIAALAGLSASRFLIASAKPGDEVRPIKTSAQARAASAGGGASND